MASRTRSNSLRWKISFFLVCFSLLHTVKTKEEPLNTIPNPNFVAENFNSTVSFRQNICQLHQKYMNGTTSLARALEGFSIRTAIICPDRYCKLKDGAFELDPNYPGLAPTILDELAKRAGFNWRDNFTLVDPTEIFEEGKKINEFLLWQTLTYDMAVSWWTKIPKRLRMGIDFPEGWYDASIIIVGKKIESRSQLLFGTFLLPFHAGVWIMILVTIVLSGTVYWILDVLDRRSDKRRLHKDPIENIFITGVAFTTHFEFKPRTKIAWGFALSVSFWSMIVASAYTANLASFLVRQNTPYLQIDSVEDAVNNGKKICVLEGTGVEQRLTSDFRDQDANFIQKSIKSEIFQAVLDDECEFAAVAKDYWETHKQSLDLSCKLEWIGRQYKDISAGFTTRHDSGRKCTSLISDVIGIHMLDMMNDGTNERLWTENMRRYNQSAICSDSTTVESSKELKLNLKNMGGVFIVHYTVMAIVCAIALFSKYSGHNKTRNERIQKEERTTLLRQMQKEKEFRELYAKAYPARAQENDHCIDEIRSNHSDLSSSSKAELQPSFKISLASIGSNLDPETVIAQEQTSTKNSILSDVNENINKLRSEMRQSKVKQAKENAELREYLTRRLRWMGSDCNTSEDTLGAL